MVLRHKQPTLNIAVQLQIIFSLQLSGAQEISITIANTANVLAQSLALAIKRYLTPYPEILKSSFEMFSLNFMTRQLVLIHKRGPQCLAMHETRYGRLIIANNYI